jgi:predicted DCC family thiol-disulfide oxidoreductase YuxK
MQKLATEPLDPMRSTTAQVMVYHDGACPLCNREIALLRRLDWRGRIRFVDAADPSATCPLERDAMLARLHAVENGVLLSGAAAFAAMWRVIPVLRPFGLAARWRPLERLLEAVYCWFLKYRPRFQALMR